MRVLVQRIDLDLFAMRADGFRISPLFLKAESQTEICVAVERIKRDLLARSGFGLFKLFVLLVCPSQGVTSLFVLRIFFDSQLECADRAFKIFSVSGFSSPLIQLFGAQLRKPRLWIQC